MSKYMTRDLQKWVRAIAADDELAFQLFFDDYYPRLYGYAITLLNSNSHSEEVVSDVFVKVWKGRQRLPAIENLDHYMFRSVKNQALNYLEKKTLDIVDIDEVNADEVKGFLSPDFTVLNNELADKIAEAIDSLPSKSRLIFGMIRQDGLKYKEVADQLDLSVKTVENQMTIAMKKIREKLTPYFKDNPQKLYSILLCI
ncbi:MAG: RNA polymerase sigma-70 factor [Cyclobacteriaceae bacterium]